MHIRVSYTVKSNNYAPNLLKFFALSPASIDKAPTINTCKICKSSQIVIKNHEDDVPDKVVYGGVDDPRSGSVAFDEIRLGNRDSSDMQLFFKPRV